MNTGQSRWLLNLPLTVIRYHGVLRACALEADLEVMLHGDATEVGTNGQRTSGGQRQRICLARAIYSTAPVLLLDDVLSAVDAGSAKLICDNLFRSPLLNDRCVLLVSYYAPVLQVSFAPNCADG
jgi:ABC-type multidrug transport system fused ATPase/permease subunit